MKIMRSAVDPEGYGGRHSESAHSTLLQCSTKLCHVCERARGCSVSIPRTSLEFLRPFIHARDRFSRKGQDTVIRELELFYHDVP